ncbi:MAG: RHS repeat protein, partial [Comamonadaceae bacterium]
DAGSNTYVSREGDGAYDRITVAAGVYTWTDGSTNATEVYEAAPALRLLASRDAMGKGFTYVYDADGRLERARAQSGESTFFVYDPEGLLTQVRSGASLADSRVNVRYVHDDRNRLQAVIVDLTPANTTDAAEYRTDYTYEGDSSRVTSIAQTDRTRLVIAYEQGGTEHRVTSITDALGRSTRFAYLPAAVDAAAYTLVTDALGQVTRFDRDAEGQLLKVTPPAGAGGAVSFTYTGGNVTSVVDAAGATTTFAYDDRGNRTSERDALGNLVTRTYNPRNLVEKEVVDGETTRHVYDAAGKLLRFSISPEGRVTEHRYDDFGREITTLAHARALYTAAEATTTDEATLKAWALTQAAEAVVLATMTYDARGQLASLTRNGSTDTFVHDQRGLLLERRSAATGAAVFAYDGLGRLLATTDKGDAASAADDIVTTTVYLDAAGTTRVTMANGLVSTSVYDKAGLLVATVNSAGTAGEARYVYDAAGRLRMTEDATQVRSFAMSASPSCFLGGMCGSVPGARAVTSGLSSGFPGTTTGPSSPPFITASKVSSSSP